MQSIGSIRSEVIDISANPTWRLPPANARIVYETFHFLLWRVIHNKHCSQVAQSMRKLFCKRAAIFPISAMPWYMQFKLQPKSTTHAEIINILVNPPILDLGFSKFRIYDQIFHFRLCQGICSSNLSQKAR